MDLTAEVDTSAPAPQLFGWIDDLGRYPDWLTLVARAQLAEAHRDDIGPAWSVDLRARLGPLARAKRLRMVRTTHDPSRLVVFERRERDARNHSPWVLRAEVAETTGGGSRLVMRLHYGGGLFGPVVERLLRDEIDRSRPRLAALSAGDPMPDGPTG